MFSHEESLAAGCSPGKAAGESATDPEEQSHETATQLAPGLPMPMTRINGTLRPLHKNILGP